MNLPALFLADLPPEADMTPMLITEACQALRRNREQHLINRSTDDLARDLESVGAQWLRPDYPLREYALQEGKARLGFSEATLAEGLDALFREITAHSLRALVEQDLGHPRRLDDISTSPAEQAGQRASIALGPELLVQVTAGNIPSPAIQSIVLGLMTRSAQFIKCASGTSLLPRLFAHSVHEADPHLGACIELAEWRGGTQSLDETLFAEADCVTATGADETLTAIQHRLKPGIRFIGYGHRVSFGYVCRESLTGLHATRVVSDAAADVIAWNQLGCLSPHVIYVEEGGTVSAEEFAGRLAEELSRQEQLQPRGALEPVEAATIASRRSFYQVRAAHSRDTRIWQSPDSTAWTVVFESDPQFQASCLNRFVYVKSAADLETALHGADRVRGKVSTVGLSAPTGRAQELAAALSRWGVSRVCPIGKMQQPPFGWRHDGRPALGDLISWTDWEF